MRLVHGSVLSLLLLAQAISAQSLGDLARKEREKKGPQQKSSIQVSTDELKSGKLDLSPSLDPARKNDLDYLLEQLSHPKASPELLAALVPLKDRALPRLLPMLASGEPLKGFAPSTALTVLGNTEGLALTARLLNDSMEPVPTKGATRAEAFRKKIDQSRIAAYALDGTKFGVWRFTEGSELTPEQVVGRLQKGPPIEIVGGSDNGQRIFNRALHDKDPNLRRGAIALVRVATGGKDFGFLPDEAAEKNESAFQQITTFLTTERAKVIAALGSRSQ